MPERDPSLRPGPVGTATPRGGRHGATGPAPEPAVVALMALGWVVADEDRAERLFALTGLDPVDLRARAAEPALHAAVLSFIASHEPDLIACAEAIGVPPATLAAVEERLAAAGAGHDPVAPDADWSDSA